jgi:hypothetical protein
MKDKLILGGVVLVAVFLGVLALRLVPVQTGGDFPMGNVPTQLMTGVDSPVGSAPGYVQPVGGLALLSPGGVGAGGTAAANNVTVIYTATTTYPAATVTLGGITAATSTTSTVVSYTACGFSVGDACEASYNGGPTSTPFGADSFVSAVSGCAVSATVTFWNGASSAVTLLQTSTATGVSSTLKDTCFHTGV